MLDLLIVTAFVVYAVSSGFRSRKQASKSLNEYFLAGQSLKGWQAGFSMAATQFAADTPLLVTGLIATGGIFLVWRLWIYGIAFLLMAFVFAAFWRRSGVLTDAEFTEIRYSGRGVLALRVLKAFYYGTVINCVVMAMVLVAAMRIAEVFLPWNEWLPASVYTVVLNLVHSTGMSLGESALGLAPDIATANNLISVLVILGFTALYSTTGGLRSVVATDVMQFSLAMIGTAIYAWVVVDYVGGLDALGHRIVDIYGAVQAHNMLSWAPTAGEALAPFLVIIGLQWFFQMNSDGTGYLAQRSMACDSDRGARVAGVLFAWMQIVLRSLIWLVIGVGLLVVYPFSVEQLGTDGFAASREILFVTGINDLLPPGIRGIMLTGLLAALASTLDTHLNWGASYYSNDLYKRLICKEWLKREPKNVELVLAARLSNVLIVVIALTIMANLGSIQTAWFISLMFGAGVGSVLVMRWLWERINLYSELAAIVTSLVVAVILLYVTEQEWARLGIMALCSTAAAVGITFVTRDTEQATLNEFYRRVHPFGWWRKTATAAGDDPRRPIRRLWNHLLLTGLGSLSLFLVLVGVGRLLVHAPGDSMLWPVILLIAGFALVPTWWKAAFGEEPVR